jgi:hypothetical protein
MGHIKVKRLREIGEFLYLSGDGLADLFLIDSMMALK